ncbi:glutamate-1-semialdehyde 2,1-aminomutase [Gluconacetobacter liquefaciens]|uniref:Aminotransferase class III-fold pyridoxal phosphate-dependent enzyme n=1 Tax=Gluconacetobacter liquefaciens TaxID=89584 RepID=A0A370FZD5_GLULI|nr:aminotransferase class III-fold pyridoxal phosphate-dependent enzyme [Gluconacetobacter liquefaciens]MBB2188009.1 aminotransferase class III-fold pyridoxal phosphate-dependent enzyme [Gluconacetobacter liquefaciens]RDI36310.1 glutamate-1-semialdehyde 2,1-aminomutase [Gluconacetobacter liquefaciens]GEB39498.1 glutamate-1-semialdehyde 2,1-aminomutase [Gluconacetobacter liquefaciens]
MSPHPSPVPVDPARIRHRLQQAEKRYVERHEASRASWKLAELAMPGGNTRTSLWYDPFPLCFVHGHECYVNDADGHDYIDFLGEYTAGIYGHSPRIIQDAINEAVSNGINLSSHNALEGAFANLLTQRFRSMDLLRFTNSGTEANLMAMTAARAVTGREKILVFRNGYHGGVLSFTGATSPFNAPYDFLMGTYNAIEETADLITTFGSQLAAVLVEPMQGAGGCIPGTTEFLAMLRQMTEHYGIALIFDEIQTARLAFGGRQAQIGIYPDLTTIGKFFGGGMAFGCFGGSERFMSIFDPRRPDAVPHAGTFNNNTITMSAGYTATRHLLGTAALEELNRRGDALREAIRQIFKEEDMPFSVTGLGSLMTIHPEVSREHQAILRKFLFFSMVEQGIYFAPRGLIALSFPISAIDIKKFLDALRRFCTEYHSA